MRFEYKYVVPMERLDALREDILRFTTRDVYTLRRTDSQYTVRSIYFDTAQLTAYREKLEGIKIRRKLRVRGYNNAQDGTPAFLEIKMKVNQRGTKYRSELLPDDVLSFFSSCNAEVFVLPGRNHAREVENAERFLFHFVRSAMKPTILVTYEREAFQGTFDPSFRITFDKHLRFSQFPAFTDLYRESNLHHLAPGFFVVEVKFWSGFAPWLQTIVKKHGLTRTSVSKYGSCVAATGLHRMMGCATIVDSSLALQMRMRREAIA